MENKTLDIVVNSVRPWGYDFVFSAVKYRIAESSYDKINNSSLLSINRLSFAVVDFLYYEK